jgi:signal transduction histidine kinase
MNHWEEMKAYVAFNEGDEAALRAAWPLVQPHRRQMVDHFYAIIEEFPAAAAVFSGPAQVERLKLSLMSWIEQLLNGPWDDEYWARRHHIGHVHVRVGLPDRYVFTAMHRLRADLCDCIQASGLPVPRMLEICRSIGRITDLELAVMSSAYMEAHEHRQLKSLQDLIVEKLPVTVLVLDGDGRVTSATEPGRRLFGDPGAVGQHYERYLPRELVEQADLPTAVGRALAADREVTLPRVVIGQGADSRNLRLTLVPLHHELARLLIHIEDLTDVVQAEARLRQAENLARIGGLAAHMAHEIRNPLAAISATLQVIVGSLPQDDRRKAILGKVQEQVHRLDRLVTDLLGFARPAQVKLNPVAMKDLARDAAVQAGVPVAVVEREGRADCVLVDREYAVQVLVNLIQNARDAVEGEGRVELHLGPGPQLRVLDDGPGIPDSVADQLFEPFVTTKTRGTGLGLAICRKLVLSMGGRIALEPTSDTQPALVGASRRGAAFCLELPPVSSRGRASPDGTEGHSG